MSYAFRLGEYSRPITTSDTRAQHWFDRGLAWLYAYNHEEAVNCFRHALEADADCAMAWFGIAYAAGPFYNRPWIRYTEAEVATELPVCFEAACNARRLAAGTTAVERALVDAICKRYQAPGCLDKTVLDAWHAEFAAAMRALQKQFPRDLDVLTLFAEAAITCTPRQLWNLQTGAMRDDAYTAEIVPLLQRALAELERNGAVHAGIAHIWIHTIEMSPNPELALKAADSLRLLMPDAGHLEHMPGHIYILCGDYAQALQQSRLAVVADDKYLAFAGDKNFYTTARCHDLHLYMYAAMFVGQFRAAMFAADRIVAIATPELLDASAPYMASLLDSYSAMRIHVLVRFGRWHELIAMPAVTDVKRKPINNAMLCYGQGVAHAALGNVEASVAAQEAFACACDLIPEETVLLSNPAHEVLAVAESMLEGELQYRRGNYAAAFTSLRKAVACDDNLNYTEPWAWMHPPRHALGALLAEQAHFDEAEALYRADLGFDVAVPRCCQHPGNVWALLGFAECLEQRGDAVAREGIDQQLRLARARADDDIQSSCFCRQPSCCE